MGTTGTMQRRLKRPDPSYVSGVSPLGFGPTYEKDAVAELTDARRIFKEKTGGKLRNVKTATNYQKLSEAEKKRYKKLNPQDFEEDMSVSKKTLLGG
jgi:hypothetical protein